MKKLNKILILVLSLTLTLLVMVGCGSQNGNKTTSTNNNSKVSTKSSETKSNENSNKQESSTKTETSSNKSKSKVSKYDQIKSGMSYKDVVKILGEGKEAASDSTAGIKTKMYQWNIDGDYISVMFQNDKVINKAHGSLDIKTTSKTITLEMYNKVKEGMTYEQVKNILGEGEEMSSSEMSGIKIVMYNWVNPGGSNMNVLFQNNKLVTKAQFGLE